MNNNLLLYGSIARGDSNKISDVDLLTITNDHSRKDVFNHINISFYNKKKILKLSQKGALFIYHLNQESKILIDEANILKKIIFEDFFLRENYFIDIEFSLNLLEELYNIYEDASNYLYINSKICWCVRTFYAAIGANDNIPIFSKKSIVQKFGRRASVFLSLKNRDDYQKKIIEDILKHFNEYYKFDRNVKFPNELCDYRKNIINNIKKQNNNINSFY